jgi:hypothetical protein
MRELTIFPRGALVYLGGMNAVCWWGRLASTICVGCAVTFLGSRLALGSRGLALLGFTYGVAVVLALGSRLAMLHSVVVTSRDWMLLSLVARANFIAPIADVYEQEDDVIALGIDGTAVLAVDRFSKCCAGRPRSIEETAEDANSHIRQPRECRAGLPGLVSGGMTRATRARVSRPSRPSSREARS